MSTSRGRGPASWWWAVAIVAALLPLRLHRAAEENSLWLDEIYSLVVAHDAPDAIVAYASADRHPPTYYLLLHYWIRLGESIELVSPLLWARSLNVLVWVALCAGTFAILRHWRNGGLALAPVALLAIGGQSEHVAKEMRGYALGYAAVTLTLPILLSLLQRDRAKASARVQAPWWIGYGLLLSLALWSHLLAGLALLFPGLLWLATALRRPLFRPYFWLGIAAHLLPIGSFLPWVKLIAAQVANVQTDGMSWMTPASFTNLLLTPFCWYIAGAVPGSPQETFGFPVSIGLLSLFLPAAFATLFVCKRNDDCEGPGDRSPWLALGAIGVAFGMANAMLVWGLTKLGIPIFHGPRYTLFGAGWFALGIGALAAAAAERRTFRFPWAAGLCLPFALYALLGSAAVRAHARFWGLGIWLRDYPQLLPPHGEKLWVYPMELARYFRETLRPWEILPAVELNKVPASVPSLTVLRLNHWEFVSPPPERILDRLLYRSELAERIDGRFFPEGHRDFRIVRLQGLNHPLFRREFPERIAPRTGVSIPESAVSIALPGQQRPADGWWLPEVGEAYDMFCWGSREESRLRFDRPVEPGRYRLHLVGYRNRYPVDPAEMTIRFSGAKSRVRDAVPAGSFHLQLIVEIAERTETLTARVRHPVWRPSETITPTDFRTLTWLFNAAWLEREPPP